MNDVIYALSGDPVTVGHINIVERALGTFDRVVVGLGINPKKKYTFELDERERLTRKVLSKFGDRVIVKSYSGLLADFAYENQIKNIIRGARNSADFDFERLLADINQGFNLGLETYILFADQKLSHVSSSAVKELQEHQAKNVIDYVPLAIKEALELRISGQLRVGITGSIGNGKSYVEEKLLKLDQSYRNHIKSECLPNIPKLWSIDMDVIGRYILKESVEPIHQSVRQTIADKFGKNLLVDGFIDVSSLLDLIFDDSRAPSNRYEFEKIMAEPIMHLVRKRIVTMKGIILICSALFVEQGICDLVNNNFIFVSCPDDIREKRLKKRGYTNIQIQNRLQAQLTPEAKLLSIKKLIREKSCGEILEFNNVEDNDTEMEALYKSLKELYGKKI